MRLLGALFALGALLSAGAPAMAQPVEVDVELVLAADGSGSIDDDELAFQREGYAAAIESPEFLNVVEAGLVGAVALAYVEWGGPASQHTIVEWTLVSGAADAARFAEALRNRPRAARGYNSISEAIAYSHALINQNGFEGLRKVIDVSGDGPNIGGRPLELSRQDAVADGITINGLVITRPGGVVRRVGGEPLIEHYRRDVIGGPAAFVMSVDQPENFAEVVRRKLVQEIARR
ncbi:DUF1194 domain-containing protein [Afifella sp. IM 167]|uniref:DUF1194 domain-containing protein n=1 Tax=Afifella sp. IM 167 TaxID=2033586 RepID=UPI001CCD7FEC|nr:DUF1194 domain-containing protein [Afifella sp. IM 167]MBZ8133117.1 hypothetical protein [Afifella sp. IM 167]